jgi:hypothetical protein
MSTLINSASTLTVEKISERAALPSAIQGTDILGVIRPGTPNVDYQATVSEVLAGGVQPIQDPTALNGTTDATTARLIYGINVIRTSTTSDFCARLPLTPQKGKSVVVVNLGSVAARIFPSVTGGKINNVVDGHVDIAPSAQTVTIYCYENPDPGDWTTPYIPLSNVITIPDFSISHTNGGGATNRVGTVTPQSSGVAAGTDVSHNITLTPTSAHWRSENFAATAVKMKVYTNIVAGDSNSDLLADRITVARHQAYKDTALGSTVAQWETIAFGDSGVDLVFGGFGDTNGIVNGGVLNSPCRDRRRGYLLLRDCHTGERW